MSVDLKAEIERLKAENESLKNKKSNGLPFYEGEREGCVIDME
jgi:hypothetical protein